MNKIFSKVLYIPGLTDITTRIYQTCDVCQRNTLSPYHAIASMGHVPRTFAPGQVFCIDVMGPIFDTVAKERYVIVLIDR